MAASPEQPPKTADAQPGPIETTPKDDTQSPRERRLHSVAFVSYPKLLFIWPLILAGLVFWPLGYPGQPHGAAPTGTEAEQPPTVQTPRDPGGSDAQGAAEAARPASTSSRRLEVIGWIYLWVAVLVLLTLGVDVDRNQAAFWVILVVAMYVLGMWLRDVKHFTVFGDLYRWFGNLDVQYDRSFGLAISIVLLVPYVLMVIWGHINDRWRITHNEFEHFSFGRLDDSLGRGAKTIRTSFPDMFELLLGLAGTLVVYNATGTKELRRIPHVMFLPLVRKRLDKILETTAITTAQLDEEDEEDNESP